MPQAIVIATGSEVSVALEAARALEADGISVRIVSMPNTRVFDGQPDDYRETVLPQGVTARVAIEAGVTDYWRKYVGLNGAVIGIDAFGESAPASDVFEHFGINAASVAAAVRAVI